MNRSTGNSNQRWEWIGRIEDFQGGTVYLDVWSPVDEQPLGIEPSVEASNGDFRIVLDPAELGPLENYSPLFYFEEAASFRLLNHSFQPVDE
ncbi:MAG: hypothetical protein AAFS06_05220 [Cyanobacteria bacterium J06631_12]